MVQEQDPALHRFLSLWPRELEVSSTKTISLGSANAGITVYYLSATGRSEKDSHCNAGDVPVVVVRKRTLKAKELNLAKVFARHRLEGRQPLVLPDVYMTWNDPDGMDLFLEFIPGVGQAPTAPGRMEACALASAMSEIRAIESVEFKIKEPRSLLRARTPRSLLRARTQTLDEMACSGFLKTFDLGAVHDLHRSVRSKVQRTSSVLSHNDVGWSNCSLPGGDGAHARLIDFGMLGYNTEGAELHHLLIYCLKVDALAFFDELIAACSDKWQVKKDVIRYGCVEYAIHRGLTRVFKLWQGGKIRHAMRASEPLQKLPRILG